ncbi:protein-tyrosine phosphatase [Moelleriella libera RCEF 2490]|uniref:Protein-tyrosine phosphatase n=1 Tax=Moelleriella libera RCEF 2490 TaxID=1081109 RepID=A0A168EK39_9HYPO|nr:protein-tyrosine phosphatase [Moelleriella libera RCEF 2490]
MLKAVVTLLAAAAAVMSLPADTASENVALQARQPNGGGGYPNVDLKKWHDQFDKSGNAIVPPEEAKKPQRWARVDDHLLKGDALYRSSAPFWQTGFQERHRVTDATIDWLKKNKITQVIAVNSRSAPEDPAEDGGKQVAEKLKKAGISYTAVPTKDGSYPDYQKLKDAAEKFASGSGGTLVWCGYGHGRSGLMVSSIQSLREQKNPSPRRVTVEDYQKNFIETPEQMALVDIYQDDLKAKTQTKVNEATLQKKVIEIKGKLNKKPVPNLPTEPPAGNNQKPPPPPDRNQKPPPPPDRNQKPPPPPDRNQKPPPPPDRNQKPPPPPDRNQKPPPPPDRKQKQPKSPTTSQKPSQSGPVFSLWGSTNEIAGKGQ